jgi:acetylornithine/succinyldiaminopimelate/putrescine aminotransferase
LEKENLADRVLKSGNSIAGKLRSHGLVKEVRSRGLMMAIELHDASKVPQAIQACRDQGVLLDWFLFNDRSIRLYPPLIITDAEVEMLCDKMLIALNQL